MGKKQRRIAAVCLLLTMLLAGCTGIAGDAEHVTSLPVPSPEPTPEPVCTVLWQGTAYEGKFSGTLDPEGRSENGTFDGVNASGETLHYEGSLSDGTMLLGKLQAEHAVAFWDGCEYRGTYEGGVRSSLPDGEGVFSAVNGEGVPFTYTGIWSEGWMNGQGAIVFGSDGCLDRIGTFTKGKYTPTGPEVLAMLGSREPEFSVSDEQLLLLEQYPEIWAGWNDNQNFLESAYKGLETRGLTVSSCMKDPENIPAAWMCAYSMRLLDVQNIPVSDNIAVSRIIASADGNYDKIVQLYLPEKLDSFRHGARMHVYGIPLAVSTYTTVLGREQPCLVILAADVYFGL